MTPPQKLIQPSLVHIGEIQNDIQDNWKQTSQYKQESNRSNEYDLTPRQNIYSYLHSYIKKLLDFIQDSLCFGMPILSGEIKGRQAVCTLGIRIRILRQLFISPEPLV